MGDEMRAEAIETAMTAVEKHSANFEVRLVECGCGTCRFLVNVVGFSGIWRTVVSVCCIDGVRDMDKMPAMKGHRGMRMS